MDFMFDWDNEGDRFSFEDSDRFEEDSLCSWISEPESLCNNWRGWKKQHGGQQSSPLIRPPSEGQTSSLVELAAQSVACNIPFEVVEYFPQPIPEYLQLRIAFWSFPENEEDIRLYSCLANGSADEFQKGEHLYKAKCVRDALQIGFHLSSTVIPPQGQGSFNVAVVFDRRRISSCNCTCNSTPSWCAHVVALCLYRIHQANSVCLRAPVSESLSRLQRDQLQKFAQYLISELPQQILPTAQRLLDELLSSQQNAINTVCGAPDPTAGPSASEQTSWCLDADTLHENVKKTLIKFCVPSPMVFSDVNYLSSTAPPAAAEWQSLLRPLRGREPEGMWNLLSIVREMYRRNDSNAVPLLEILTDEVLQCEQILVWWFSTKISSSYLNMANHISRGNGNNSSSGTQHAASSLCDELVTLWRLAALNPRLSPIQREDLAAKFKEWHISTIDKVRKARGTSYGGTLNNMKKNDVEVFPGFKPSLEACQMDWSDYPITGVTYSENGCSHLQYNFSRSHDGDMKKPSRVQTVTVCSEDLISTDNKTTIVQGPGKLAEHALARSQEKQSKSHNSLRNFSHSDRSQNDGACSSGSEGFCEPDRADPLFRDSDSSLDIAKDHGVVQYTPGHCVYHTNSGPHPPTHSRDPQSTGPCERVGAQKAADADPLDVDSDTSCQGTLATAAAPSQSLPKPAVDHSMSDTQHSSDEFLIYFYDTKAKVPDSDKKKKDKTEEPNYFAGLKAINDCQENQFARAEALHAHGHTKEASKLAKQLAEDMLDNPPDLLAEAANLAAIKGKGKKKKAQNVISMLASNTLSKAAFLCSVLAEDPDCHHLAFKIGMFGLEMPRPPASCKALEVKLAYQESELVSLLKKIPLGPSELTVLRDRAEQLRDGKLKSRGEALLPLMLASFIFDSLCLPMFPVNGSNSRPPSRSVQVTARLPSDEKLGFEAAVAALGLKANVSEADHPLLCEGTRRQKGDLAIAMLVHYKDDQVKLSKIMDKLLDKEVHQLFKAPSLTTYLASKSTGCTAVSVATGETRAGPEPASPARSAQSAPPVGAVGENESMSPPEVRPSQPESQEATPTRESNHSLLAARKDGGAAVHSLEYLNLEQSRGQQGPVTSGARPKTTYPARYNSGKDTEDSSALEEEGDDFKALEAKLRCMSMKKKPSQGMASIDSSAPETTSSDNSPTLVRRHWAKHQGPGSDSGSSGKSSDSIGSSSSGDKGPRPKIRDEESPVWSVNNRVIPQLNLDSRSSTPNIKGLRYKGKNRVMPTIPNQPSEASAHFMFELAKTVLTKAGGNSSTSLFTQPTAANNHTGPHRALHLCAFQIGLYALGLHNCVSPNWLSRTYSSHVSWITGQAMEIGAPAINILIETWEGHLTPPEVASLADRASRGRDPNMVRTASELALSCLPHAHALNPSEIQRALIQCKEQSRDMLERACLAVESAAKGGGVYPEVLFDVAKRWYDLSEQASAVGASGNVRDRNHREAHAAGVDHSTDQPAVAQPEIPVPVAPDRPSPTSSHSQIGAFGQPIVSQAQISAPQVVPVAGQLPTQSMVIPYPIPPGNPSHPQLPPHAYVPYSYVQPIQSLAHHYSQPHIPVHTHNIHPAYVTYPYQNQPAFSNLQPIHNLPPGPTMVYHPSATHLRPPPTAMPVYTNQITTAQTMNNASVTLASIQPMHPVEHLLQPVEQQQQQQQQSQNITPPQPMLQSTVRNQAQMNYLMAAYRVGMLAMETLARRVHDDRPQTKYARNPPYGEDVKWLLAVAMKLGYALHVDGTEFSCSPAGTNYLQQFCASAVNAVVSPFILYDIAVESAHILARNNPTQVSNHLRSNILNPLVQKCLQMFIQCAHQRIHHINQNDYEDFITIVCSARNAFFMTPGGIVQFNEFLQSLRRSKSCRKDLWTRIVNALSTGGI
ncbi:zinc finger SWIM domain-containing protein 8-like isoform X2 [Liolophura sinensis]|uniref:zinc finger SWIM domain-containing protein 8-like isoform X2 n=1 Tax=Liolophura sinensis TaxID=3198878 RepID=UPI0031583758